MVEFQSSEPRKSKIKIKVKIGENEIDIEGTISDVQESLELVPEIINKLAEKDRKQEEIGNKEESNSIEENQSFNSEPNSSQYPKIIIEKNDSLSVIIFKMFEDEWGKNPRKLNQVKEALESRGLIYPRQSVAVSLLRLAQSGKLRRFKGKNGEFVYISSIN